MIYIYKVIRKEVSFYQVPNELAQINTLTYAAKGLLIDILSRPPGYKFAMERMITKEPKQSISRIRSIFKELQRAGYLCFWIGFDERNRFTSKRGWIASEVPMTPSKFQQVLEKDNDLSDIFRFQIDKLK